MSVLMGGGTDRSLPVLTCLLPAILPRLSGVVGLCACAPYGRRLMAQRGLLLRALLVVRMANVPVYATAGACGFNGAGSWQLRLSLKKSKFF